MSENPSERKASKDQVDLRLPRGMRTLVQKQADKDNRSMNAQIVHYVEAGLQGIDNVSLAKAVMDIREAMAALEKRLGDK